MVNDPKQNRVNKVRQARIELRPPRKRNRLLPDARLAIDASADEHSAIQWLILHLCCILGRLEVRFFGDSLLRFFYHPRALGPENNANVYTHAIPEPQRRP